MVQLEFTKRAHYAGSSIGITIPVTLASGTETIAFLATVDTGASNCLFERAHGELLGLNIESGERKFFATATGRIETFGHFVSMDTLGLRFECLVYFFANPSINKNLLGRIGWLDRTRLGLIDYDQVLFLAPYDID